MGGKFRHPVVVGLEACGLQLAVGQPEKRKGERGINHFGGDAVHLHILDPLIRVPSARTRRLISPGHYLLQLLALGAEGVKWRDLKIGHAGRHENQSLALVNDSRSFVAKSPVQTLSPQGRGFNNMSVGRNNWRVHDLCSFGCSGPRDCILKSCAGANSSPFGDISHECSGTSSASPIKTPSLSRSWKIDSFALLEFSQSLNASIRRMKAYCLPGDKDMRVKFTGASRSAS